MEIIKEGIITDAEAKGILEKRAKETELKYEQKNALDYFKKFVKADDKKVKSLVEELKAMGLRDKQAIEIANFLPQDKDDLKAILSKEFSSFNEEQVGKVLEAVKKI